jgi:hypothetical protein
VAVRVAANRPWPSSTQTTIFKRRGESLALNRPRSREAGVTWTRFVKIGESIYKLDLSRLVTKHKGEKVTAQSTPLHPHQVGVGGDQAPWCLCLLKVYGTNSQQGFESSPRATGQNDDGDLLADNLFKGETFSNKWFGPQEEGTCAAWKAALDRGQSSPRREVRRVNVRLST